MYGSVGERIKELRESKGISQNQLAKMAGLSQSGLWSIERDTKSPSVFSLQKIADALCVSLSALLEDDYDGYSGDQYDHPSKGNWIPVRGRVAAGLPIDAIEEILGWEEIAPDMNPNEYFALQIKGDSMAPRMTEGDVIIVHKQNDVESGEAAIVAVNGDDATCKRVRKTAEGIILIPNNPAFEHLFYSSEEVESLPVRVIGKVVELRGKL